MSQTTPQVADTETTEEELGAPSVRVLVTAVPDADLDAALATIRRQVYEPFPDIAVIGASAEDVESVDTLEAAIASTDSSFDYLWIIHADARPRPDALSALVAEAERNEASLAGSKLLKAGTMDELESVGGATDVFGEPYSGLDEGEIDLQQYDVVREVAFVRSASMLVRRDLAQGLRGLDPLLPPVAAGLDFSQRTRLAGGKVITVPSSEVYHQGRCGERGRGWREQAGRLRAIATAYSPLTLLWVIPYDFLVSILDSIASLFLLRWKPLVRHIYSWLWNTYHLPSTIKQRRRLRTIRSEGDEELFRFHAKGSIRLRSVGEELSGRILSLFDDDQALAKGSRRVWGSPGIWGAVLAAAIAFLGARTLIFTGMPNVAFSFPFEPPSLALERWFSGWNEAGLGSGSPVHPSVGSTGLASLMWFGAEGAARTILTVALSIVAVAGMGRLGGRVGLRGPGRYLAGIVVIAGPGTAALTGHGSWLALAGAATLPWAVRTAFVHPHFGGRSRLTYAGWALLTSLVLASFSPLLALVPLITVALWRLLGGERGSLRIAAVSLIGVVAGLAFTLGDPGWITDSSRRLGPVVGDLWPALLVLAALPFVVGIGRHRSLALTGVLLGTAGLAVARLVPMGPGLEEAILITASFGAALIVAAALDGFSRNVFRLVALAGGAAILIASVLTIGNGRLGLPSGDVNERLAFAGTLSEEPDPGRILHASIDRELLPGEVRPGPGFWYRVLDGTGTTSDELWLPPAQAGDEQLEAALVEVTSGSDLRPGEVLADFAIAWVVLEGPSFRLDEVLTSQLDLVPLPLDPDARVFENTMAHPIAGSPADPWQRAGLGFAGDETGERVRIAVNHSDGWKPGAAVSDWAVTVAGSEGSASFSADAADVGMSIATLVLVAASAAAIVVGRRRS